MNNEPISGAQVYSELENTLHAFYPKFNETISKFKNMESNLVAMERNYFQDYLDLASYFIENYSHDFIESQFSYVKNNLKPLKRKIKQDRIQLQTQIKLITSKLQNYEIIKEKSLKELHVLKLQYVKRKVPASYLEHKAFELSKAVEKKKIDRFIEETHQLFATKKTKKKRLEMRDAYKNAHRKDSQTKEANKAYQRIISDFYKEKRRLVKLKERRNLFRSDIPLPNNYLKIIAQSIKQHGYDHIDNCLVKLELDTVFPNFTHNIKEKVADRAAEVLSMTGAKRFRAYALLRDFKKHGWINKSYKPETQTAIEFQDRLSKNIPENMFMGFIKAYELK